MKFWSDKYRQFVIRNWSMWKEMKECWDGFIYKNVWPNICHRYWAQDHKTKAGDQTQNSVLWSWTLIFLEKADSVSLICSVFVECLSKMFYKTYCTVDTTSKIKVSTSEMLWPFFAAVSGLINFMSITRSIAVDRYRKSTYLTLHFKKGLGGQKGRIKFLI
jgi:hypothetical protein